MAMLAEPRRRQRIGPNPRGKFFMEDEDNKGRALLHKLGWQAGKGLGRENQGMSAPIQPKIQMDSKGLGFDIKSNPWVAHTEEFSQVLEGLKPILPNRNADEKDEEEAALSDDNPDSKLRKLEKMSKSSRSRIHYHKFVKSKDVSNFSNTDLKCIFGRPTESLVPSKNKKKKKERDASKTSDENADTIKSESGIKQEVKDEPSEPSEPQQQLASSYEEDGVKVINRGSMLDYFKSMMALRKMKALDENSNSEIQLKQETSDEVKLEIKSEVDEDVALGVEICSTEHDLNDVEVKNENEETKQKKKSKKNKRKRKAESQLEDLDVDDIQETEVMDKIKEEEDSNVDNVEDSLEKLLAASKAHNYTKKEKRRKAKRAKLQQELCENFEEQVNIQNGTEMEIEQDVDDAQKTKKDKKKKKKNKKDKKSKKSSQEDVVDESSSSPSVEPSELESMTVDEQHQQQESTVETGEVKEKKKKKKKKKENVTSTDITALDVEGEENSKTSSNATTENEEPSNESSEDSTSITPNRKRKLNKKKLTMTDIREISALSFPGSNLHDIPGYGPY